jgi:L-alanine-DL-glutamate epimerase-like enolase superfamily enzyme
MVGFAGHEHLFVGQDPMDIERHYRVINNIQFHYGRCWPLDLALWDLAGKITGQPVYKLLGGLTDRVKAYASSGTLRSPEALADVAERYIAQGFKAMKIRFHRGDWRKDIAALAAVRARIGNRLELMVDCNQGWRLPWDTYPAWSLKDALVVAKELEPLGVHWMEEPLHRSDREGMRRLREMTSVRIAGGETPHTWTNGMGVMANAHLVCGMVEGVFLEYPYDPPEWGLDRRDYMMAEPLKVDADGMIVMPTSPGLGYALDEDMLARTRVG